MKLTKNLCNNGYKWLGNEASWGESQIVGIRLMMMHDHMLGLYLEWATFFWTFLREDHIKQILFWLSRNCFITLSLCFLSWFKIVRYEVPALWCLVAMRQLRHIWRVRSTLHHYWGVLLQFRWGVRLTNFPSIPHLWKTPIS